MFRKGGYQTYIIKMFRNRKWEQEFLCYQWLNVHEGVACWNFFTCRKLREIKVLENV
jgi:hypothetical protein